MGSYMAKLRWLPVDVRVPVAYKSYGGPDSGLGLACQKLRLGLRLGHHKNESLLKCTYILHGVPIK